MSVPFNGLATVVSVQAEDVFNGASAQTVYFLVGKTRFTQKTEFAEKRQSVDVWRNQTGNLFNTRFYTGTIEIEFGFNIVTQIILAAFFEVVSTTSLGGGLTQYNYRPARLQDAKSFKIGMSFNGESFWTYAGLVIDGITLAIRRNQVPSLTLTYKAASQNQAASSSLLGTPTDVQRNISNHTQASMTLDSVAVANLTEANLIFQQTKKPARFSSAGLVQRFGVEAFFMKGQFAEYFNPQSAFPACVADQAEHQTFVQLLDPANASRKIQVTWPRVNFTEGEPDAIGKGDLVYRANVIGFQSVSEPTIALVI